MYKLSEIVVTALILLVIFDVDTLAAIVFLVVLADICTIFVVIIRL